MDKRRILKIIFMFSMALGAIGMIVSGIALYDFYVMDNETKTVEISNNVKEVECAYVEPVYLDKVMEPMQGMILESDEEIQYEEPVVTVVDDSIIEITTIPEAESTTEPEVQTTTTAKPYVKINDSATDKNVVHKIGEAVTEKAKPNKKETTTKKENTTTKTTTKNENTTTKAVAKTDKKTTTKKNKTNKKENLNENKKQSVILSFLPDGYANDKQINLVMFIVSLAVFVCSAIGLLLVSRERQVSRYSRKLEKIENLKIDIEVKREFVFDKLTRMVHGDEAVDRWKRKSLLSEDAWLDVRPEEESKRAKSNFLADNLYEEEAASVQPFLADDRQDEKSVISKETSKQTSKQGIIEEQESFAQKARSSMIKNENVEKTQSFLADDKPKKRSPFIGFGRQKVDIDAETEAYLMNDSYNKPLFLADETGEYSLSSEKPEKEVFIVDDEKEELQSEDDYVAVFSPEVSEESLKKVEMLFNETKRENSKEDITDDAETIMEVASMSEKQTKEASEQVIEGTNKEASELALEDASVERDKLESSNSENAVEAHSPQDNEMIELVEEDLARTKTGNSSKKIMKKKKKHKK